MAITCSPGALHQTFKLWLFVFLRDVTCIKGLFHGVPICSNVLWAFPCDRPGVGEVAALLLSLWLRASRQPLWQVYWEFSSSNKYDSQFHEGLESSDQGYLTVVCANHLASLLCLLTRASSYSLSKTCTTAQITNMHYFYHLIPMSVDISQFLTSISF